MDHMVIVVEYLQNLAFGNVQLLSYKAKSKTVVHYLLWVNVWLNVLPLDTHCNCCEEQKTQGGIIYPCRGVPLEALFRMSLTQTKYVNFYLTFFLAKGFLYVKCNEWQENIQWLPLFFFQSFSVFCLNFSIHSDNKSNKKHTNKK